MPANTRDIARSNVWINIKDVAFPSSETGVLLNLSQFNNLAISQYNHLMEHKYTGIILSKKDISEADRIYSIYTKEAGKIKARAVGVKKATSKLAGSLENFNLADITIVRKNGMGKITSVIVENGFSSIRKNFDSLASVYRSLALVDQLIILEEKDENVFDLLKEYLETADESAGGEKEKVELLSYGFILKLLKALGYKLEAGKCVYCGEKLSREGNFFSAEQGGIVCQNCAAEIKDTLNMNINAIKLIRLFFTNNLKSIIKIKAGKKEIEELKIIVKTFLDWIAK